MTDTQRYVVNMTFGHGTLDEVIEAEPKLVQDWEAAGYITPIDDDGNRIVKLGRSTPDTDTDDDTADAPAE